MSAASTGSAHASRQAIAYCPYCSEETLFPLEGGGWECRSCLRAFSVTFLGLVSGRRDETEAS
jgi:ribosomal protein L37AE/L43A